MPNMTHLLKIIFNLVIIQCQW